MKKVAIGSQNPVKIQATENAFRHVWPDEQFEFVGIEVDSEVAEQPLSDDECITGAMNRARKAREAADADFGVGAEGGISTVGGRDYTRAWIVVRDKSGNIGIASSVSAPVAPKIMALVREGLELGTAQDRVTGNANTKQKGGYFGLVSGGIVSRELAYTHAIIMALAPFRDPDLYSGERMV